MGRAIGGMGFVRCTEVVRLSEGPLLEVSLYTDTPASDSTPPVSDHLEILCFIAILLFFHELN